jgi:hypothetical protein
MISFVMVFLIIVMIPGSYLLWENHQQEKEDRAAELATELQELKAAQELDRVY